VSRLRRAALGLGVATMAAVSAAALAQTNASAPASAEPPTILAPPVAAAANMAAAPTQPLLAPPAAPSNAVLEQSPVPEALKPAAPKPSPASPPGPPRPTRSPAAILQALDKVTAETLRFEAPINQPIRYKNLVFVVKACETTGLGGPTPAASAYLVIDSAPLGADGVAPLPSRRVFTGWMFADSPGLHPFQHPVYDAWLISCMASSPPA